MEIQRFLSEYKRINSECTRVAYRGYLTRYSLFLDERGLTPEAVHPVDIEAFAKSVKNGFNPKSGGYGLSDVAVQSHLAAVSSYYRWRRCRDKRLRNPVSSFKYRRSTEPQKMAPLIASASVTAMGEQTDCEVGNVVVKLFYGSGIRLAELVSLNRRDVKIDVVYKGNRKMSYVSVKVRGKGRKNRIVPLSARAATALLKYLTHRGEDSEPALILSRRKRRISRRTVQRLVHEAAVKVGAGHCHPHVLRHRFATDAIEGGLPDKQLKKHLGQVSLEHTYRYIHLTEDEIDRGFKQASDRIYQRSSRNARSRAAYRPKNSRAA